MEGICVTIVAKKTFLATTMVEMHTIQCWLKTALADESVMMVLIKLLEMRMTHGSPSFCLYLTLIERMRHKLSIMSFLLSHLL